VRAVDCKEVITVTDGNVMTENSLLVNSANPSISIILIRLISLLTSTLLWQTKSSSTVRAKSIRTSPLLIVLCGALLQFSTVCTTLHADEGMWLFNNLPRKQLADKYEFDPTPEWTEHVMKSSVRFNSGGSGSFVSSTGLILTNHHVGADVLHKISSAGHDYYKEGFWAKTRVEEQRAPDLELNVLQSIEDVTNRVGAAVKPQMSAEEAFVARRSVISAIEKESFDKTGLRSDVVTLYQGGQYHLYRYKKYTDIRLVFAPEFAIAFFGGDPDNFEYPRYDLDICLFRAYEDDKPVKIDHFLKWSKAGGVDGDLVFVSGHPGKTDRLDTVAALKYIRDVQAPTMLDWLRRREIMLQQFGERSEEHSRIAKEDLFGVQNSRKSYYGRLAGLQAPSIIARKEAAERQFRDQCDSDPQMKKAYSNSWEKIEQAQQIRRDIGVRINVLEGGRGFSSTLFGIARTLVRLAAENEKPSHERLPEFSDAARGSLELGLYSTAPIYEELEIAKLGDGLGYFLEKLGTDTPLAEAVMCGKNPGTRATELIGETKLKDVTERKRIAEGGPKAIAESNDPLIVLARLVDPDARAIRKKMEIHVVETERQAYSQISRALFELHGTSTYPDATFTLRLSFGTINGYEENANKVEFSTTLGGAFKDADRHGNKSPWALPPSWHQHRNNIDLNTPYNFVSTCDIIGGNSGSPVINRAGEFVGIIFDGNIQSLVGDFVYDERQNRAISVHSASIVESLKNIYGAAPLVRELGF